MARGCYGRCAGRHISVGRRHLLGSFAFERTRTSSLVAKSCRATLLWDWRYAWAGSVGLARTRIGCYRAPSPTHSNPEGGAMPPLPSFLRALAYGLLTTTTLATLTGIADSKPSCAIVGDSIAVAAGKYIPDCK